MARAGGTKSYFNFIAGKHSDGSSLSSPENTAKIMENVDLEPSGKLSRRLGIDYEENHVLSTETFTDEFLRLNAVGFYEWVNVAEDGRRNFYVVRVGEKLFFYNQSGAVISNTRLGDLDISSFSIAPNSSLKSDLQVASGKGVLFVSGELYDPFFIEFDTITETFSATKIEIRIRDFEGVEDGLEVDEIPATLDPLHNYNLLNQGWRQDRIDLVAFPSNSEIEHLGIKIDGDGVRVFDKDHLRSQTFGNTRAPNGHFILNAFDLDRLSASGLFGLPIGGVVVRPRSTAFFAGRVWYGGVKGKIYFSRIVERLSLVGDCFQEQDPTSEDFNELLDTDGGVIAIPELGEVYKIANVGNGLVIMASNGIWIVGGDTENFTANTASVAKVSEIGIVNYKSVVLVENNAFFWTEEGIYVLAPDQNSGRLTAQSLSDNRINQDYHAIPALSRVVAQGAYDRVQKRIYWSYHDGLRSSATALEVKFNAMMIYDLQLNAFYDYRIEDNNNEGVGFSSFMAGYLKGSARNEGSLSQHLVASTTQVTANGVLIATTVTFSGAGEVQPKILTFAQDAGVWKLTFAEFCSRTFHDWFSQDTLGANFTSIIETNPESLGEVTLDKQATYLFTYYDFKRNGFVSVATNPRPDPGKGFRVTQNVVEVLRSGLPNLRVTQNAVEVLRSGTPKLRVTQNVIEILRLS